MKHSCLSRSLCRDSGPYAADERAALIAWISPANPHVQTPSLVLWGRHERDLSKPIFDALPDGAKWSYESIGRHGDAMLFEDVGAWDAVRAFLELYAE